MSEIEFVLFDSGTLLRVFNNLTALFRKYLCGGCRTRVWVAHMGRLLPCVRWSKVADVAKIRDVCATAYFAISVTVPAPTVCPPSRIANRNPFSMAMGVISSISRFTLSPGITISVPPGNSATPVTSVVRK
jgi:hypothetical protein